MPKQFVITSPDGRTYEITAPDGATVDEAIAYVKQGLAGGAAAQPKHATPAHAEEDLLDFAVRKAQGVKRGAMDLVDGGAQLLGRGFEAIAPAGSGMERWAKSERELAERNYAEGDAKYKRENARNEEGGWDGARLTGNALASAAAVPVRVAQGAGMLGRAFAGAKAGAAGAALQPVEDTQNFWPEKLKQTGTGFVAGGALTPVAEVAIGAGGKLANAVVDKARVVRGMLSGEPVSAAAERIIVEAVGPDWARMGAQAQASLREDVAKALHESGVVNPAAVRRLADFRAQGVEPRTSWVTRDPVAFTREENLAGIKDVGEPLQQQRQALDRSLIDTVEGTSPRRGTDFELGSDAVAGVRQLEDEAKAKVDGLYTMFRETAPDVQGNPTRFVDRVSRELDDAMVGGQLPSDFVARLQAIAAGKFPITPSTLFQMQKAASAQSKGNPSLGIFKKAVDDELQAMADELGPTMQTSKDLLGAARATAKQRFDMQEAIPAMKAVAEGTLEPERFFAKYVAGGSVKEVANMWNALRDQNAKQAIRGQLTQYLRTAATGAARDDGATFAQATFNKTLQQPGITEKLRIILGDRALADLQRVGRVAEASKLAPAGNKVNTSNTSQAGWNLASNLLGKASALPGVGPLAAAPLRQFTQGREVTKAMNPGAAIAARSQRFGVDPELAKRLAALLAAPAGAAAGSGY